MADTYTTNLSLTKPEIGASTDTWGNKINANADTVDALFPSGRLAISSGGTGASSASDARIALGLGSLATLNSVTVSQISDNATLAKLGSAGTITGAWTFTTAPTVPASTVTTHQASLSIAETQIPNGSLLARVGDNETVSGNWTVSGGWTISGSVTRSGQGRYVYLNGSGNTGGAVTISASAPTGTPANGDIWIQYS